MAIKPIGKQYHSPHFILPRPKVAFRSCKLSTNGVPSFFFLFVLIFGAQKQSTQLLNKERNSKVSKFVKNNSKKKRKTLPSICKR